MLPERKRVCVGVVVGSRGLKGQIKVKSFMENPTDIGRFGPLTDKSGERKFKIQLVAKNERGLIARFSGIKDRNASEAIKGTELYMLRDMFPKLEEDEF